MKIKENYYCTEIGPFGLNISSKMTLAWEYFDGNAQNQAHWKARMS
jgi:hypothetical protein